MKALIQKELRENLKWGVLGFVCYSLLLFQQYRTYREAINAVMLGNTEGRIMFQPLASDEFIIATAYLCGLFGALLGWFQIHNERHHELWGFLVHRPLTRTRIFAAKALAGLALYLFGAGVPLLWFVGWALIPGHVAAPFEWSLLKPVGALFAGGAVCYFAAMLARVRSARWYASRGLPLGAPLFVGALLIVLVAFWQGLLAILIAAILLGTAVWGAFHSNGGYRGLPAAAKAATTGALLLGTLVLTLFGAQLVEVLIPHWPGEDHWWWNYTMSRSGKVYRVLHASNRPIQVLDLDGKPVADPDTGRPMDLQKLNQSSAHYSAVGVDFDSRRHRYRSYFISEHFSLWDVTRDALWYYWPRYDRLVGFGVESGRLVGSIGPDGFAPDLAGTGARFAHPSGSRLLNTRQAIYRVDVENRSVTPIFTSPPDDPIGEAAVLSREHYGWDGTLVVTRHFVYLLQPDGAVKWKGPFAPGYPDYDNIWVWFLEPPGDFAVWFWPAYGAKLPVQVTWVHGNEIAKTTTMPNQEQTDFTFGASQKILAFLTAPVALLVEPYLTTHVWGKVVHHWPMFWVSLVAAVVFCVPAGLWLTRRYSFSPGAQVGWAVFHLATGIPGLLAFLSVQEWPARVPCPKCRRLRVVDREQCEHCGAGFPPAEPVGIEIFEPVGTR